MRTPINWNQPVFHVLFCVLAAVGYMEVMMLGLVLTPRPPDNSDKVRAQPTADLRYNKIQVSRDGVVAISNLSFYPNEEIGPMQILSAALKKYPRAKKFKMNWSMNIGSSWSSDKVIYNRRKDVLVFDEDGGQGEFHSKPLHSVETGVSDEVIHKKARRGNNGQSDGGFR